MHLDSQLSIRVRVLEVKRASKDFSLGFCLTLSPESRVAIYTLDFLCFSYRQVAYPGPEKNRVQNRIRGTGRNSIWTRFLSQAKFQGERASYSKQKSAMHRPTHTQRTGQGAIHNHTISQTCFWIKTTLVGVRIACNCRRSIGLRSSRRPQ